MVRSPGRTVVGQECLLEVCIERGDDSSDFGAPSILEGPVVYRNLEGPVIELFGFVFPIQKIWRNNNSFFIFRVESNSNSIGRIIIAYHWKYAADYFSAGLRAEEPRASHHG